MRRADAGASHNPRDGFCPMIIRTINPSLAGKAGADPLTDLPMTAYRKAF